MPSPEYRPWSQDYQTAIWVLVVAIATLWLLNRLDRPWLAVGGSIFLVVVSLLLVSSGFRRARGKRVERNSVKLAAALLERSGYEVEAGVLCGHGDADLVVVGHKKVVVEIKSWIHLTHKRKKAVVGQVEGLVSAVDADAAVVWLPEAPPVRRFFLFGPMSLAKGIYLAGGNERELAKVIKRVGC